MDELEAALPRPRDDEPPDLRSRIVKELRDHLECAHNRELVLTGDATLAARRVREKFGDPGKLARKLWFDAMQEKIMSQRILVGLCAVMTAACLGLGLFTWKVAADATGAVRDLVREHHDSNQQLLEQNRLALEGSRTTNQELLRAVQGVRSTQEAQLETGELQIEVREHLSGAPLKGVRVYVESQMNEKDGSSFGFHEVTNDEGTIHCGRLKVRSYTITAQTPWGLQVTRTVFVRATPTLQKVQLTALGAPEPSVEVTFQVDWPEDLRERLAGSGMGVICRFAHPLPEFSFQEWARRPDLNDGMAYYDGMMGGYFVIGANGKVLHVDGDFRAIGESDWKTSQEAGETIGVYTQTIPGSKVATVGADPLSWIGAEHSLQVLGLGGLTEQAEGRPYGTIEPPPRGLSVFRASRRAWRQAVETKTMLDLKPGAVRTVRIPLPEDLIATLRTAFAAEKERGDAEAKN